MTNLIFLGILVGLFMSALSRRLTLKEIVGFSILAIGGVFYGSFLASVLEESTNQPLPILRPLLIGVGGFALTSLKIMFLTIPHRKGHI